MAWPEKDARCKRHPRHKQSKGVCPSCLRERLARLNDPSPLSSAAVADVSSSSTSSYSSGSVSSCSSSDISPPAEERLERLKKSKSMAAAAAIRYRERNEGKKRGFWAKLLAGPSSSSERGKDQRVRREGNRKVMSLHSMTVKERSSSTTLLL